jgi:hypothetical protein
MFLPQCVDNAIGTRVAIHCTARIAANVHGGSEGCISHSHSGVCSVAPFHRHTATAHAQTHRFGGV